MRIKTWQNPTYTLGPKQIIAPETSPATLKKEDSGPRPSKGRGTSSKSIAAKSQALA